jgi:predicted Fe-S protein YdhL (DUF1289 family)
VTSAEASRGISPCIGTCRLHPVTGLCMGCARTLQEIAAWASMSAQERSALWDELDERGKTTKAPQPR